MKEDRSSDRLNIKELIVVEGKNDAHAVRRALGNVDVIWTEGFGLTEEKLTLIQEMAVRCGVIVCTDPDYAGNLIRERIKQRIPQAKHVYISRQCAISEKGDDIGLENVSVDEIKRAFSKVLEDKGAGDKAFDQIQRETISMEDLVEYGLTGQSGSAAKRSALGKILGIGDTNAKQFLFRFRRYALSKEDLINALKSMERAGD